MNTTTDYRATVQILGDLVQSRGILGVVDALSAYCYERADMLADPPADLDKARLWAALGNTCGTEGYRRAVQLEEHTRFVVDYIAPESAGAAC